MDSVMLRPGKVGTLLSTLAVYSVFFFGGEVDVFTDTAILLVGGFRCSS